MKKISDDVFKGILYMKIIDVEEIERNSELIKVSVQIEFATNFIEHYLVFWCTFEQFQQLTYEVI